MILNITSKIALASAALVSVSLTGSAIADVNVVSWGGAYTASQQKGYEPTWTGEKINWINYNGGLGEVRAQVESGNVQWDIVDVLPGQARTGCDEGLFEEIPDEYRLPTPDGVAFEDDLMVPLPNKCVVPQIWWSYAAFSAKKITLQTVRQSTSQASACSLQQSVTSSMLKSSLASVVSTLGVTL